MSDFDSRSSHVTEKFPRYHTSESLNDDWGQPPASHYMLVVTGTTIQGQPLDVYIQSASSDVLPIDAHFSSEMTGWDRLSDEAFRKFEEGLP